MVGVILMRKIRHSLGAEIQLRFQGCSHRCFPYLTADTVLRIVGLKVNFPQRCFGIKNKENVCIPTI